MVWTKWGWANNLVHKARAIRMVHVVKMRILVYVTSTSSITSTERLALRVRSTDTIKEKFQSLISWLFKVLRACHWRIQSLVSQWEVKLAKKYRFKRALPPSTLSSTTPLYIATKVISVMVSSASMEEHVVRRQNRSYRLVLITTCLKRMQRTLYSCILRLRRHHHKLLSKLSLQD